MDKVINVKEKIIEKWTIKSIEDLYQKYHEISLKVIELETKHKQDVCFMTQLNERIEFLENKLMSKEEKEYLEKHGDN